MVSKSTYVAVFVAVMMATVSASAVVIATHDDDGGIVLEYKGNEKINWDNASRALNDEFKKVSLPFEVKWSAMSNGLRCVCDSDEFTVAYVYEFVAGLIDVFPYPDGITTIAELEKIADEPANNYHHWNMYDEQRL